MKFLFLLLCLSFSSFACICTEEYKPVCGEDGKTYSNSCQAQCQSVKISHSGKCSRENDYCVCTKEYKPVCGVNGITYSNACEAKCSKIVNFTVGPCKIEPVNKPLIK